MSLAATTILASLVTGVATAHLHAMFSGRSPLLGPRDWRLPRSSAPTVALTFDDGPDPNITPRVLDLLDAHGVRATFFMIGVCVGRAPHLAEEVVARGHAIANHSMTHRHDGMLRGRAYWRREISDAERTIEAATGRRTRWFRPPLGHRSIRQSLAIRDLGYRTVMWSCRSWDATDRNPQRVLARIERARRGRDIVLLHDGIDPRRPHHAPIVLDVLPLLLQALRDGGTVLTTLPEILGTSPYAADDA